MKKLLALIGAVLALVTITAPALAAAPTFPALTGRVVDEAHVLSPEQAAALDAKLAALATQSQRQLVVVTVPDLQGFDIADYGYQLGRTWKIGDKVRDDGALLIVAPTERKVRIEVGYGLEGIITDALSSVIIQTQVLPRFRANDMPGGIAAATDALITQLQLPEDQARQIAAQARPVRQKQSRGVDAQTVIFLLIFFFFFVLPMLRRMRGGKRYGGGIGPVVIWPGSFGGGGGGGGWGGGGGGGFSGGGGGFGGGGASGGW